MSRLQASFVVWGVWVAYFLVFELWNVLGGDRTRWLNLSTTVDDVEKWWWPFQFLILVGLAILMVHWAVGGPIQLAVATAKRLIG